MKYQVILASQSPRRQQLLAAMGIHFTVRKLHTDEYYPDTMEARKVARYLAEKKAEGYSFNGKEDELIITADTTVVLHGEILGKPTNEEEAKVMLQQLSGKIHEVITGVCVRTHSTQISFDDTTKVKFRILEQPEIDHYVQAYQPLDKAGSYAIQEWIGMIGIEKIQGSYFNVVGLSTEKLYKILKSMHAL
jgi:septum formation protein